MNNVGVTGTPLLSMEEDLEWQEMLLLAVKLGLWRIWR